jgi:hypothetical protein
MKYLIFHEPTLISVSRNIFLRVNVNHIYNICGSSAIRSEVCKAMKLIAMTYYLIQDINYTSEISFPRITRAIRCTSRIHLGDWAFDVGYIALKKITE